MTNGGSADDENDDGRDHEDTDHDHRNAFLGALGDANEVGHEDDESR